MMKWKEKIEREIDDVFSGVVSVVRRLIIWW